MATSKTRKPATKPQTTVTIPAPKGKRAAVVHVRVEPAGTPKSAARSTARATPKVSEKPKSGKK
jgi:hypothetical protein